VVAVVVGTAVAPAEANAPTSAPVAASESESESVSGSVSVPVFVSVSSAAPDPDRWGNRRLAAQLTFSCVDMAELGTARRHARAGIGGITLLGDDPPDGLRARLRSVRDASTSRVEPFVASDEEGGTVQRLRRAIYPLPSARTMGGWSAARVRRTAHDYALRMRRLGVRMDLGPVADLSVAGYYIDSLSRSFSRDPRRVSSRVRAWRLGMRDAGVVTVVKHWPGHGQTRNSHTGPARVPPLTTLEGRDLLPFTRELADGAPVVMVGHLLSRGLTRGGVPTSLSPRALHYLRRSAGPDTVILTDSLAMAAASSSLGITPARAAVRSLRAGADWAMACDAAPLRAVAAIRRALDDGTIARAQAVDSALRILALKARRGLAP